MSVAIVTMIKSNFTNNTITSSSVPQYDWTISQKNYILGIFLIGYVTSQLFVGRICELVGPRKVLGYSIFLTAIITLLIPVLCEYGFFIVVIVRYFIGVFSGPIMSAYTVLVAKWIPSNNRSKMMSNMSAVPLGVVITYQLSGYLNYYHGLVFFMLPVL